MGVSVFLGASLAGFTGAFARFGRVLSVLLDDERFPDAAVVCLEASGVNIVTAIRNLVRKVVTKALLFQLIISRLQELLLTLCA